MADYRILIVDDQRDARRTMRAQLEALGLGLQVAEVSSGEEALLVLSRQSYHLLIANLRLAGMSGLELLAKARLRQPELRVILVLSAADRHLEAKIDAIEWVSRVYKPLEAHELAATVRRSLGLDESVGPPQAAEVETPPQTRLAERLGRLRRELDALAVNLLDDHGQVVAQAGDWQQAATLAALVPALMASYSAAEKVSLALGRQVPQNVLFFTGAEYDLALAHVGSLAGLLVVTAVGGRMEVEVNLLPLLRLAASDVLHILTDMGLLVPRVSDQLEPPAASLEEAGTEADLGSLEAILQQAREQQLDVADIDQFWDALVENQAEKKAPGTGELSYEQAHQIGLTPEEK